MGSRYGLVVSQGDRTKPQGMESCRFHSQINVALHLSLSSLPKLPIQAWLLWHIAQPHV